MSTVHIIPVTPIATTTLTGSPILRPEGFVHQLPSVAEIDESPSPPSGIQNSSTSSTNSLPHKRSLSSAMNEYSSSEDTLLTKPYINTSASSSTTGLTPLTAAVTTPSVVMTDNTAQNILGGNTMVALISEDSYLPLLLSLPCKI